VLRARNGEERLPMTCGPPFASLLLSSIVPRAPKKSRRARMISELEHFHYSCDVVGLARCSHSFTPARKDRALGPPIQWNGRARFSFSAYTNSENALAGMVIADHYFITLDFITLAT
jgi:hypothetical protein